MSPLRPLRCVPCLLAMSLLVGCQSYETGVEVICQAPKRCSSCDGAPEEQKIMLMAQHADGQLRNAEARKLLDSLGSLSNEDKVKALREAAERAELTECPFADHLESTVAGDGEPAGDGSTD